MKDKEPEIGDIVCVSGVIREIRQGIAIVEIFRPSTDSLQIGVQVGGLELNRLAKFKELVEVAQEVEANLGRLDGQVAIFNTQQALERSRRDLRRLLLNLAKD